MPQSWRVMKLGEICKIGSGGTPGRTEPEYWNGDIPWVKTGEINYNLITLVHRGVNSYTVRSNDFSRFWAG
jgi:type I restriction enzyme S subunit